MLQETPDDRFDPDILRQPGHAGPQATNAANHEIDLHAGLARRIKRIDDHRVDQRVAFAPDRGRAAGLRRVLDLSRYVIEQMRCLQ